MNYGIPYKGSKNKIAENIIAQLPPAKHFYDLFGGGGAMTLQPRTSSSRRSMSCLSR